MNKTIAILCGGPPKPKRNRHLEKFNGKNVLGMSLKIVLLMG